LPSTLPSALDWRILVQGRRRMTEAMLFTYAGLCGFATAAVLATGYQWVTNRPARFEILMGEVSQGILTMFLRALLVVWAAPYIIMRNAVRGRLIERRPVGWLFASLGIAMLWSLCVGILTLSLVLWLAQ
jgi:hypothetical protein